MKPYDPITEKRKIIWTSSLDLTPSGVDAFCIDAASHYGKTAEELKAMPLMDLAITYMWSERRRKHALIKDKLSAPTELPILVILDKADFGNQSHMECSVLSGESLSQILNCAIDGLSVTFYSDGKDIRCESLTENGADHFLFREITEVSGISNLVRCLEAGEAVTDSELSKHTKSLLPQVSALLGWESSQLLPLNTQIANARDKADLSNQSETELSRAQDAKAL